MTGMGIEISDIRIREIPDSGKLKAVASITLNGVFAIHDIKIIQGDKRWFVAMPSRKNATDGTYMDTCHPLDQNTRMYIQERILDAYFGMVAVR